MTVSNETYKEQYNGNDVLTNFSVGFYFFEDSHLEVILYDEVLDVETVQVLTTDYTVNGAGNPAGGSIDMIVPPTSDEIITIIRAVPLTQLTDYIDNDPFPAESHEAALDKATMRLQQQQEEIDRSLKASSAQLSAGFDLTLPTPVAGGAIGYNATLDGLAIVSFLTIAVDTFWEPIFSTDNPTDALAIFGWLDLNNEWNAVQNYAQTVVTLAAGAATVDMTTDGSNDLTLDENATIAFSNLDWDRCVRLIVTQDGVGGWTLTLTGVDFGIGDSAVNTGANKTTIYEIWTDGTDLYGTKIWEEL